MNTFITTAISYSNGPPHIGHAFEFIIADALSRFYKMKGDNVFLQTGMDEHGQKIEKTAYSLGVAPIDLCDEISLKFKDLNTKLNVDYDRFIRTTEDDHKKKVHKIFRKCIDNNDIYLGEYVGWYNTKEETFVTELEASKTNYIDPTTNIPYSKMKESSYFFRLSKYHEDILSHIENHPNFIIGSNDIINRLKQEPLTDISISRTTINWGIRVPISCINEVPNLKAATGDDLNDNNNCEEKKHVFYVWFDALTNYLTGCPNGYWPPTIQVIGKDIVWFHSVIWIAMLMSAKLSLPKQLFVHSFINDKEGKKMSKSIGNVVCPTYLINKYPVSAIRYYLLKENVLHDVCFSEESLIRCHDNDLLPNFGNLVNRVFSMFHRYCKSITPKTTAFELFNINEVNNLCTNHMKNGHFHLYCEEIFKIIHTVNTYVNDTKIWEIGKSDKDDRTENDREIVIKTLLESLFIISHFLYPIVPLITDRIIKEFLNTDYVDFSNLTWNNICDSILLEKRNTILFTIIDKDAYESRKQKNVKK